MNTERLDGSARAARSRERRILIGSAAAYTIPMVVIWLQPFLLAEILAVKATTEASAGLLVTAEMTALSLSSLMCVKFGRGIPYIRIAILGMVLAAIGNALSFFASSYWWLFATRIIAGAGEGTPLMVGNAAVAGIADPDRAYAKITAFSIVVSAALIYAAPALSPVSGGRATAASLLACCILLSPAVILMPRSYRFDPVEDTARRDSGRISPTVILTLVAFSCFTIVNASTWSFFSLIGQRTGLTAGAVNHAIAVSIVFSIAGSLAANWVGSRWGRFVPVGTGLVAVTIALWCLSVTHNVSLYRGSMDLNMFASYFAIPFFFGYAAGADSTGRGSAWMGAVIPLSFTLGPLLGGIIFGQFGYRIMGPITLLSDAIAFVLILYVERTSVPAARAVIAP